MYPVVKIADTDVLARAALNGGDVDLTVRIPVSSIATAWNCLYSIMDDGAPHLEAWRIEEGRSDEELRLLCGLLCHVADNLPMDTKHFLNWQEKVGERQYLDEFAQKRVESIKAKRAN